jgi:hypothetical protein
MKAKGEERRKRKEILQRSNIKFRERKNKLEARDKKRRLI